MPRLGLAIAAAVLVAACGGTSDTASDETPVPSSSGTSETADPCALVDDATLAEYFGDEAVEAERGEMGSLVSCRWSNANSAWLAVQVASDHDLTRPDPCDGCIDLPFADDGYAAESPLQSSATFVVGTAWYSVTTTGFGDDAESITDLAETIFENAVA
jgi:hypothetical protein